MEIDRNGGVRAAESLPAARAPQAARRVRTEAAAGIAPSGDQPLFDEAIDIHLGVDRQTGHLAIVGGDVRFEPRPADRPAARPRTADPTDRPPGATPSPGSHVNVVA